MRRSIMLLTVIVLSILSSSCGCGCTPPTVLGFVLDSAGQNISSKYAGLRVTYSNTDGQVSSVPNVQLLMSGAPPEYTETKVFDAMNTIQVSVNQGVSAFQLAYEGKQIATFTLKAHKEAFSEKYLIDELQFNGQKLTPVAQSTPNTYVFKL